MNGRRNHVIARLALVHVVVGMDRLAGAELTTHQLTGPIGHHLIDVHIARGARAGLKNINGELVVEFAFPHFLGGRLDGFTASLIQ